MVVKILLRRHERVERVHEQAEAGTFGQFVRFGKRILLRVDVRGHTVFERWNVAELYFRKLFRRRIGNVRDVRRQPAYPHIILEKLVDAIHRTTQLSAHYEKVLPVGTDAQPVVAEPVELEPAQQLFRYARATDPDIDTVGGLVADADVGTRCQFPVLLELPGCELLGFRRVIGNHHVERSIRIGPKPRGKTVSAHKQR